MEPWSTKKQSMTQNSLLSEEILVQEIMPKLPTKSIIRFKSVSKLWQCRISEHSSLIATKRTAGEEPAPIIMEKKCRNSIFFLNVTGWNLVEIDTSYLWKNKPDAASESVFSLIGSCNGVVCLQLCYSDGSRGCALWNPATREVNFFSAPSDTAGCDERFCDYALGFDAQAVDLKVVRVEEIETDDDDGELKFIFQIFSRNGGHWGEVKPLSMRSESDGEVKRLSMKSDSVIEEGLTVGGTIYWACLADEYTILSFDVGKEEFLELDGPPLEGETYLYHLELVEWNGSLGAMWVDMEDSESQFWLKNNSNTGWTRISLPGLLGDRKKDYLLPSKWRKFDGRLGELCISGISHHFHTLISPN